MSEQCAAELEAHVPRAAGRVTRGRNAAADARFIATMAASAPGAQGRLSGEDVQRYSRQMLVPGFFGGAAGQLRLKQAHVLVVGCGGLGCPSAMCLAGAGVGTISLVDDDVVATSNLHRQLAHTSVGAERGQAKVDSLKDAMLRLNPTVDVRTLRARVNEHNALELVRGSTVVLDCTDNPATRYLVGDACALAGVPLVSAAALGCDGQLSLHGYRDGPCYRCLHPSPPRAAPSALATRVGCWAQ